MQAPDDWDRPDAVAPANAPALPSLLADNCIRTRRSKARFLAQENIRLYIEKYGVDQIGVLTVTAADTLQAKEYQKKWHSFRTNFLKKTFDTGMWTRERQPRSGNWHSHSVVNVGFDIRTGFPFDQVANAFYANVDRRVRDLWKRLRTGAEKYGFGRVELLPVKKAGEGCAIYLTKYLGKALVSDKCDGEERCRLFGIWGSVRFVYSRFDWTSNRIIRRRKAWLAEVCACANEDQFRNLFRPGWWSYLGTALMRVIMPEDYYKVKVGGELVFDELGLWEYESNLRRLEGISDVQERITHSHYELHWAHGMMLYRDPLQATQHAMHCIGYSRQEAPPIDPQLYLELEAAIARTRRSCSS